MSVGAVGPDEVRSALRANEELCLIDVRPEAAFATGHPLFAASSPLDRLELDILDRVPRLSVPVVVYGEDGTDATAARHQLNQLGYSDVRLLEGGLEAWRAGGGELFADVNAPSKAFGELVAVNAATPQIEAGDLSRLLDADADVVVLDARRWDEYQTMSIPQAINVPGAGLVAAMGAVAADPSTLVVVQCAGRTRSLIGAQSLIDARVANRVVALRNGTIGWTLAGLSLEHGQARVAPPVPAVLARRAAVAARRVAGAAGVGRITQDELDDLRRQDSRTIYCFDVRSPEEFGRGHVVGFRPAPGGQLVQETDRYAPVRGALIVLSDDEGGRADMTGAWLAQMGWSVMVVVAATAAGHTEPGEWSRRVPAPPATKWLSADRVASSVHNGTAIVVDIDFSARYQAGHIPGAHWARRAALRGLQGGVKLPSGPPAPMIITSEDDTLTALACRDLGDSSVGSVAGLEGGTQAWLAAGLTLEKGYGSPLCAVADVYRRPYEGTDVDPATMQAYLDWEYGLVAQLRRDDTHRFWVLGSQG